MPTGIAEVDGVVQRVGIAVGSDTTIADLPPVGLQEAAQRSVVVAGLQIGQPALGIGALADVTLAFGGSKRVENSFDLLAEWLESGRAVKSAGVVG